MTTLLEYQRPFASIQINLDKFRRWASSGSKWKMCAACELKTWKWVDVDSGARANTFSTVFYRTRTGNKAKKRRRSSRSRRNNCVTPFISCFTQIMPKLCVRNFSPCSSALLRPTFFLSLLSLPLLRHYFVFIGKNLKNIFIRFVFGLARSISLPLPTVSICDCCRHLVESGCVWMLALVWRALRFDNK